MSGLTSLDLSQIWLNFFQNMTCFFPIWLNFTRWTTLYIPLSSKWVRHKQENTSMWSMEFPWAAPLGTPSTSYWYFPVLPFSRQGTGTVLNCSLLICTARQCIVQYYALLKCPLRSLLQGIALSCTMQYVVFDHWMLCCPVGWIFTIVLCCTIMYSTALYCTSRQITIFYCTALPALYLGIITQSWSLVSNIIRE